MLGFFLVYFFFHFFKKKPRFYLINWGRKNIFYATTRSSKIKTHTKSTRVMGEENWQKKKFKSKNWMSKLVVKHKEKKIATKMRWLGWVKQF